MVPMQIDERYWFSVWDLQFSMQLGVASRKVKQLSRYIVDRMFGGVERFGRLGRFGSGNWSQWSLQ